MGTKEISELAAKYGLPIVILLLIGFAAYRFLRYSAWPFVSAYLQKNQEMQEKQIKDYLELLRAQFEEMQSRHNLDQARSLARDEQFLAAFAKRDELSALQAKEINSHLSALTAEVRIMAEKLQKGR